MTLQPTALDPVPAPPIRASASPRRRRARGTGESGKPHIILTIVTGLIAVAWLIPLVGLLITSLRTRADVDATGWWTVFVDPFNQGWSVQAFSDAWTAIDAGTSFWNSVAVTVPATVLPVISRCRSKSSSMTARSPGPGRLAMGAVSASWPFKAVPGSHTYATPPVIPAAKLRPVGPSTRTRPPVMYSQPWSEQPSMTAVAPELRTANRCPTRPARYAVPPVAP